MYCPTLKLRWQIGGSSWQNRWSPIRIPCCQQAYECLDSSLLTLNSKMSAQVLCPKAFVGFSGDVRNGLLALPDGETWVRASGSSIILGRLSQTESSSIQFLSGHSDRVRRHFDHFDLTTLTRHNMILTLTTDEGLF